MANLIVKEFLEQAIYHMEENLPRINTCLDQLNEDEVWLHPNKSSNSIANLILHLCGNIHQYIISSLGNAPDIRERDKEFLAQGVMNKEQLSARLNNTVIEACNTIKKLDETSLLKTRIIQGIEQSGIRIIIHVTEHFSYHTGQIVFYTKLLKDKDLGLFNDMGYDLNAKNE